MTRGGRRENAGRKSTWASGRSFGETKLIRVPTEFADQLLEIAHQLDAEEISDLVVSSDEASQKEIDYLNEQIENLRGELKMIEDKLTPLTLKKQRDKALGVLKMGTQSATYRKAKEVLNAFIKELLD